MFSTVSAAYPVSASSASVAASTAARTFGPRPGGCGRSPDSNTTPCSDGRSPSPVITVSQLEVAINRTMWHAHYRNFELRRTVLEPTTGRRAAMPVIRTTRFEVAPADVEEMIARRNALVAAVRNAFPGLTEARLARVRDQVWIDSWRWESL